MSFCLRTGSVLPDDVAFRKKTPVVKSLRHNQAPEARSRRDLEGPIEETGGEPKMTRDNGTYQTPPRSRSSPFATSSCQETRERASNRQRPELCNQVVYHAAVHVGQSEVAPGVTVRELLVIEAQQVQKSRVQVVYVDFVFRGRETELVSSA